MPLKLLVTRTIYAIAACNSNDKKIGFFICITNIMQDAAKKKDEFSMMAQDSLCKYMYNIFAKKEYDYLVL